MLEPVAEKLIEEIRKLGLQRVSALDYFLQSAEKKDWLGVQWAAFRMMVIEKQISFLEELIKK